MGSRWIKDAIGIYRDWREQRAKQRKADMEDELLDKRRQADVHNLIARAIVLRDSMAELKRQLNELDRRYAAGEVTPYSALPGLADIRTDLGNAESYLSVALARLRNLRQLGA